MYKPAWWAGEETRHQGPPLPATIFPPPYLYPPTTNISKQNETLEPTLWSTVMAPAKEKIVDGGVKRVKKAIEKGTNPLSEGEMHFIRTCCWILKVSEKERIDSIGSKAMRDSQGKVQTTMSAIRRNLDALGKEAENHRRKSPGPSCNVNNLDAATRSLQ